MWKAARTDPARVEARMPARSSREDASGTATLTIAELDGSSPRPARNAFASATSCSWIRSIPIDSTSSSVAAQPIQENQAGELSNRRASSESRSGRP